ncbi:4-hydroxy-3-methylbut-2-en-1-yl diphosphate synthase [Chitinophaga parva]|uniref:4-hydroxy-3-methylbut-2-en-1-yl diphosphate synthase (flavodoxin) n=1 Tax=Chitinophaga parva TaxID=2169414 RepID=A0A2T7BKV7_9BACT|nr:(E)-4-hydroxy-3-methylbut-2-enyl-diphosphate synthase [Chitinophaga parva]PUZ28269.1 4-hydroxy-3-methylbut-2-en-1-yl diphosphate synthase [Chitinophaga parva]
MQLYCNSLTAYQRLHTLEVKVGDLLIGNGHPIRVQTMTTTDTMDTAGTIAQAIRCIEAGAELVRITAPSKKEAENLLHIRNGLRAQGYTTPLVADIHFTPNAAEIAARIVEKVRINPGNYIDKKKFELIEYTDAEYLEEIDRIRERFTPLVNICKEHGTAMRIGTNHGSLSDRIMSRYGDTPMGMVESAMEFLRIAEDLDYRNIVLSMKSSNPQVMVQAYRLLVHTMQQELGHCYPLHLGVTEAGDGEDGRIKSAAGIGTLLEDGLGDTIRVSLTEDPEFELPVCRDLVKRYNDRAAKQAPIAPVEKITYSPFEYSRRPTAAVGNIGDKHVPVVVADFKGVENITPAALRSIGYTYDESSDKWNIADAAADYLFTEKPLTFALPGTLHVIVPAAVWPGVEDKEKYLPFFTLQDYLGAAQRSASFNFVSMNADQLPDAATLQALAADKTVVLSVYAENVHAMPAVRRFFMQLQEEKINTPALLETRAADATADEQLIHFSVETGALLLDGFGDGLWLRGTDVSSRALVNNVAFGILQATRTRISKTEYISCPSCGRTLFDLQETTARIRAVTHHLKGVKIAIMGCIVNGPGEMADADFGYVGSGVGKITLYRGKEVVKRGLSSEVAVDELIDLIKDHGMWVEKN